MSYLITNGRIYTMDGRVIERGYVLCEGSLIADLGDMSDCPEIYCETLDVDGGYVLPGFIDAHTHAGLFADSSPFDISDDMRGPGFRVCDVVKAAERAFSDALHAGITSAIVSPCSNAPITGQLAAYSTRTPGKPLTPCAGFKFSLGENPKLSSGYASAEAEIRDALSHGDEVFSPLLSGAVPALFHCHSARDIRTAICISEDFGLRYILVHATDSTLLLDELTEKKPDIITGPILTTRNKSEVKNLSDAQFGELVSIGLSPAVCTDYPELPAEHLALYAALSGRGVSEIDVFSAVTITPARMFGLDDCIGSISIGKACDLAIFSGHPFDMRHKIKHVFSGGERIF